MSDRLCLTVVQPTLAKYRVPVWREMATRSGVDLRVWYGDHGTLKNATADGFQADERRLRFWSLRGQEVLWHQAQVDAVKSADTDVAVLSWGTRYLSLGPALRAAKRRNKPVVLWGHGYSKNDSPLRVFLRDRIAKLASVLLFYDERTAAAAVENGWPADRVFAAPNAIDQTPLAAARGAWLAEPERLERFAQEQRINDREVLLFVSRLMPENRVELLIEAMERLRASRPQAVAIVVGGGTEDERLRAMVSAKNLKDHVRMLGPIYDEDQLAPWFLSAKAFVYPSAIGLSLLHAFGYGLPVVTDDNVAGQNPEIVAYQPDEGPEQNGLAYRANDVGSLAETLTRLLSDHALRDRLAGNAAATVADQYNIPRMVDGIESAARAALAHHGG
ncbi:MAG: glycosyltransferase family 4 protein [Planctomycetota bacterium]